MKIRSTIRTALLATVPTVALAVAGAGAVLADSGHSHGNEKVEKGHGDHGHGQAHDGHGDGDHGADIGSPGDPADVTRTIRVTMHDNFYEPEAVGLKEGETVRFVVVNEGRFVHEFNIGTAAMHAAHQDEMLAMMESGVLEVDRINHEKMNHGDHGMKHDDPNSVLLEPGQTAEIVWTFDTHETLEFACNVPGHYASGMTGNIRLSH